jgi:hypothetical protein
MTAKFPYNATPNKTVFFKNRTVKASEGDHVVIFGERENQWGGTYLLGHNVTTDTPATFSSGSLVATGGAVEQRFKDMIGDNLSPFTFDGVKTATKGKSTVLTIKAQGVVVGADGINKSFPTSQITDHGGSVYTIAGWLVGEEIKNLHSKDLLAESEQTTAEMLRIQSDMVREREGIEDDTEAA